MCEEPGADMFLHAGPRGAGAGGPRQGVHIVFRPIAMIF